MYLFKLLFYYFILYLVLERKDISEKQISWEKQNMLWTDILFYIIYNFKKKKFCIKKMFTAIN